LPPSIIALAAALIAVALAAATGIVQRDAYGTILEPYAYGFFLDRWPLFAFLILYGVVFIVASATSGGPRRRALRVAGALVGAALFLAVCIYPTFGGLVLRPAFMTGGMSYLSSAPYPAVVALGSASAAMVYALALGLGTTLAKGRVALTLGGAGRAAASFAALWLAAIVMAGPRSVGLDLGDWPRAALTSSQALTAGLVVAAALLPHAALHAALGRSRR
jgi:hypothetical protein